MQIPESLRGSSDCETRINSSGSSVLLVFDEFSSFGCSKVHCIESINCIQEVHHVPQFML